MLPPTRAPLLRTPTGSAGPASFSRTLIHVHQASTVPVEQEEEPTLRDGPVVAPRTPVRSAGRYSRKIYGRIACLVKQKQIRTPAHLGAVRADSCDLSPKSEDETRRETVGSDSHRAPEARCSRTGTLQAQTAEALCFRTGILQAQITNTASDGLTLSAFDPSLEYSTDKVVLFWHPPSYFS